MKVFRFIILVFLTSLCSCISDNNFDPSITNDDDTLIQEGPLAGLNVKSDFDFSTSKEVRVELNAPQFLSNAVFEIYAKNQDQDSTLIGKGSFNENGYFEKELTLSARADSLLVLSNYIGLIDNVRLAIVGTEVSFDYNPFYVREGNGNKQIDKPKASFTTSQKTGNYSFIDSFNAQGVPDNLVFSDVIAQNLLDDINASLPENVPGGIPISNPEFLAGKATNLVITKEADVWVTFVSEGAGYRNVLGYYTYPIGEEPSSVADIDSHKIIFPNVSMLYSGGGLIPGDRVYLGRFEANTVVSWFLVSNGWTGSGINSNSNVYYSNPNLNPESSSDNKDHMVLLYDQGRKLTLLGFEDLFREGPTDNDFNDAVFYAKSNPIDAIQVGELAQMQTSNDADGDGINDELDDFPFDADKAFNNFSPSVNSTGKLVYEDLWPNTGDYDFNDLALDYSFNLIANSENLVTSLEASFTIEKIGGSFHNGFGFVLPIDPNLVTNIEGQLLNAGFEVVSENGTESGTDVNETIILVVGDTHNLVDTTVNIKVDFEVPLNGEDLGNVPFNTFLVVNGDRTREVHLPDLSPTSKADLLSTGDDYSDITKGRYYKTKSNLPWALNLYENFNAPPESVPITIQYPRFINWANSSGTENLDWFRR